MKKITLGVCSSISIFKACEIIRIFQREGYEIQVVMTANATRLVSPTLFSALTGRKAWVDFFDDAHSGEISHIALAQDTDLLTVAPATANIIGKFAAGVADDFLSTLFLAVRCPVAMAPAMNERMYLHYQTQDNIHKLKGRGVVFIEPEKGYLACGGEGWGRLASPDEIAAKSLDLLKKSTSLKGKKVLVTAGPTREYLDPVRFLTCRSSGKMGYELAEEARRRGAEVSLISGPSQMLPAPGIEITRIQTAAEMEHEVVKAYDQSDIVIMAAAVSDFKFESTAGQKIKKQQDTGLIKLIPTGDILEKLGRKKDGKILVGFAAETENLKENALKKAVSKNLDLIVANDVSREDIGFDSEMNVVTIFHKDGNTISTEKKTKQEISRIILDEIEGLIESHQG